ncbi:MAG: hypothetical protein AAF415_08715 [Pseudomonadota bacterium]
MSDPAARATDEIIRLHDVIAGWFRGEIPEAEFDQAFAASLAPEFENIQPSGKVLSRADLLDPIRAAHGSNPDFRITIEEPRLLGTWSGLILMGYVEFQQGARQSAGENRRRSTVLFEEDGDRLLWRYLQETGLRL